MGVGLDAGTTRGGLRVRHRIRQRVQHGRLRPHVGRLKQVAQPDQLILIELHLLVHFVEFGVLDVLLDSDQFFVLANQLSLLLLDLLL